MSDRLEAVKARFDAMIEKMKEEFYRQVDLKMEVLLGMYREEQRRQMVKKKNIRARAVTRMNKAAEGGHEADGDEDSVSVKSEIESDECACSDEDDFEVKEEVPDEEDALTPVASTSSGQKRPAMPTRQVAAKKRRITPPVDNERQKSASKPGIFKTKIINIDCTIEACKLTFRCVHKMREHLL